MWIWRILRVAALLGTFGVIDVEEVVNNPPLSHLEGESPQLGDLLTMVSNNLLNGMTLQVGGAIYGSEILNTVTYIYDGCLKP